MNDPKTCKTEREIDKAIDTDLDFSEHEKIQEVPILTENVGWDD